MKIGKIEDGSEINMDTGKIEVDDRYIRLHTPYKLKDLCKSISGRRWDKGNRCWKYPKTPTIAGEIMSKFHDHAYLKYDEEFEKLLKVEQGMKEAAKKKEMEDLPDIECSKHSAWLHQRQAYWFAYELPAVGLFLDMGTGKTKIVIDLIVNRGHQKTLVICPKSVIDVWPKEFEKHSGKPVKVIPLYKGSVKKRTEEAKIEMKHAEVLKKPVVFVINYESVWRKPFSEWVLKKAGFDLVVLDESHRIKAPGGKASRFCSRLGDRVDNRIALTGTPLPHSPLDAYGQYRFLDKGIFGTSFNRFKNKYAVMGGYGNYQVLGYQNEMEYHKKLYTIAYKCDAKDVLDLPEKHHINRYCKLSPKAMKVYNKLEDDLYAEIGKNEVIVLNALTKLLRLQQITSGFLPDDEENIHILDDSKQRMLADIFEDIKPDEPIVVFARFRHDLEVIKQIADKNERSYAELSGSENKLVEWQQGEYNVIGVQIQSGGLGVDLTRSKYSIYYSLGYSLGDYLQSVARLNRPGQERITTFIHLVVEGTVDEKVDTALKNKKEVVDYVLEGVANR